MRRVLTLFCVAFVQGCLGTSPKRSPTDPGTSSPSPALPTPKIDGPANNTSSGGPSVASPAGTSDSLELSGSTNGRVQRVSEGGYTTISIAMGGQKVSAGYSVEECLNFADAASITLVRPDQGACAFEAITATTCLGPTSPSLGPVVEVKAAETQACANWADAIRANGLALKLTDVKTNKGRIIKRVSVVISP